MSHSCHISVTSRSRFPVWIGLVLLLPVMAGAASPGADVRPAALTLAEAISRVLQNNPGLVSVALEPRALDGRIQQAALKPNPELSAEFENFGGTGDVGPVHSLEATVQYSQLLELGGKRNARINAARAERAVAELDLRGRQSELIAEAAQAFVEVLAAQERLVNRQEIVKLADQLHASVVERVSAGKVSPVEETRSAVMLAEARLEVGKVEKELMAARDRLASLWGGRSSDFQSASGVFALSSPAPATGEPDFSLHPEMQRLSALVAMRQAQLDAEEAARKPDLTVSGGVRYLNEGRDAAFVAGVSIPLTLHDKRQGALAEARIRLEQARQEKPAVENLVRARWIQARNRFETAQIESASLFRDILPASRSALDALTEGYQQGKFDYLTVLDAQRTYIEQKGRQIEVVLAGMSAAIEILQHSGVLNSPDALATLYSPTEEHHDR